MSYVDEGFYLLDYFAIDSKAKVPVLICSLICAFFFGYIDVEANFSRIFHKAVNEFLEPFLSCVHKSDIICIS